MKKSYINIFKNATRCVLIMLIITFGKPFFEYGYVYKSNILSLIPIIYYVITLIACLRLLYVGKTIERGYITGMRIAIIIGCVIQWVLLIFPPFAWSFFNIISTIITVLSIKYLNDYLKETTKK